MVGEGLVGGGLVGNVVEDYGFDLKMMAEVPTLGLGEATMDAAECLAESFASDSAGVQHLNGGFDLMRGFGDGVIVG